MNMRLSSQGFLVDHVLGWAVRFDDAEAVGADDAGADVVVREALGVTVAGKVAGSGELEVSRSRSLRFPYSG